MTQHTHQTFVDGCYRCELSRDEVTPRRIQLRRTKGWRKPEGAIVVARPSKWGNPFRVGDAYFVNDIYGTHWHNYDAVTAVNKFRRALPDFVTDDGEPVIELARRELAGHDLACWCPLDQPCHADVLLEIANGGGV